MPSGSKSSGSMARSNSGKSSEVIARRTLEDMGYIVHDANVLFREHCPNIDLVAFSSRNAIYIQVRSSTKPSSKDGVVLDGAPWTAEQLAGAKPVFNKHKTGLQASLVLVLDHRPDGTTAFYLAPPKALETILRRLGRAFANKPKRDGTRRKMFPKEVPRSKLKRWHNAWRLLEQVG